MRSMASLTFTLCLGLPIYLNAKTSELNTLSTDMSAPKKINQIIVVSNPIFDESAHNSFFVHHWANYLHINTQESTILDKLSFNETDKVSLKDLYESQRLLRAESYIRDAKISFVAKDPAADVPTDGETILVETWDNWSLLPTVSLSRSGGENKSSIGIKEDNLLGRGISTHIRYTSDNDRSGYKLAIRSPIHFVQHATVSAHYYDNSDGQSILGEFNKPFYTLSGLHSYNIRFDDTTQTDTLRQNGEDIHEFEHKIEYLNLQYGQLLSHSNKATRRLLVGVTQDIHNFNSLPSYTQLELPRDREFIYPWLAYQYIEDDYQVLRNVHLINYNEDINLGWQNYVKFGLETKDTRHGQPLGLHFEFNTEKGYKQQRHLILLSMNANASLATTQKDYYQLNTSVELFYKYDPKWTLYGKARLSTSNNNYIDKPFALGDETGVRGYPHDYQYGDHQWQLTAELRNYPNINLYQLADLGWAAFIDVGHAFGGPDANNEQSDIIGSIGIGARIYSSRSSYGNVAHFDLTLPFTSGKEVNSWEWRLLIKRQF